jgi:hypothetical protein
LRSKTLGLARAGTPQVGGRIPLPPRDPICSTAHADPLVECARCLGGHRVWLRFDDGLEGEIDLAAELHGEVFQPLRDPDYFAGFRVDDTLIWPNGADFAPEFLRDLVERAQGPT